MLRDKVLNPPSPPLLKGGKRGLFTNSGLKGVTGLTLVEVMIALVVLLLVFLALMQTALVSIDSNMINVLRDEAVGIAEMRMNEARNIPFDTLASDGPVTVPRNIRNIPNFQYEVLRTVTPVDANNRQIDIRVRWAWKEKTIASDPYTHTISTILRRQ